MALMDLLLFVLALAMTRSIWRAFERPRDGAPGRASRDRGDHAPSRGVQMVRDPVCGTYVIPDRAIAVMDGSRRVFFCSSECRDKYRASSSTRSA